jgi:hypothetical protein
MFHRSLVHLFCQIIIVVHVHETCRLARLSAVLRELLLLGVSRSSTCTVQHSTKQLLQRAYLIVGRWHLLLFSFLPEAQQPRIANVVNAMIATASVNPAPRNPAPTRLIGDKAAELPCCAASVRAPHPLSCEFWQTSHHAAVVFTAEGYDPESVSIYGLPRKRR